MKVNINTNNLWTTAQNTQVGKVYAISVGGDPMLRIELCMCHEQASKGQVAFLRLFEDDLSTALYTPTQRMLYIGEPTLTVE